MKISQCGGRDRVAAQAAWNSASDCCQVLIRTDHRRSGRQDHHLIEPATGPVECQRLAAVNCCDRVPIRHRQVGLKIRGPAEGTDLIPAVSGKGVSAIRYREPRGREEV